MIGNVKSRWRNLMGGLWFLPGLVALGHGLLATILVQVDRASGPEGLSVAFGGTASAARGILSTVAGSFITVAGLAFSITIVTLQLVSSQFSPRVLRNFLGDRVNQVVAGTFVGIVLYCLLVLRVVRASDEAADGFVPSLSIAVAVGLAVLGLALLLLFIHHMASSIQVSSIAARVCDETLRAIDRQYPDEVGAPAGERAEDVLRRWRREEPCLVRAERAGYVQSVEPATLEDDGSPPGLRIALEICPGDFVTPRSTLAAVWPAAAAAPFASRLRRAVVVDRERHTDQDVSYGIRQLADIALRAISPGVNDPTTAINCIGYLQATLERLATRTFPPAVRVLAGGATVVARQPPFTDFVDEAFVELSRYASRDARVAGAVLTALGGVADSARAAGRLERLAALRDVVEAVAAPAFEDARTPRDRAFLEALRQRVVGLASGASVGAGTPPP